MCGAFSKVIFNRRHYLRDHPAMDPEYWHDGTLYLMQKPREFTGVGKPRPKLMQKKPKKEGEEGD